jgi:hypothetical protein
MILTILGLFLVLAPFLLTFYFKNRFRALLYILVIDFAFHLLLSLTTQVLHIFTYPVITSVHTLVAVGVVIFMIKFKERFGRIKINWFFILAVVIIFFELWTVHNFYTGPVNTINGPSVVTRSSYIYPYFSDEWVGASLENYSIKSHSLPVMNPLYADEPFKNPMLAFFSVISEFFLLLNLSPILNISIIALFSGIFVCLSIYLLLKSLGISNLVSIFTILCILFITNGANLPGIWYLMPFLVSFIFFVISLVGINSNDKGLSRISAFLSLIVYPPIVVFVIPAFIAEYFILSRQVKNDLNDEENLKKVLLSLVAVFFAGIFISSIIFFGGKGGGISSYIFRTNLDGGIPSFAIWNVIPIVFIPFILLGIFESFRRKMYFVLGPIIVGFAFWLFYTSTTKVFLIDYPRVVVITSILLISCGGMGLDFLIRWLRQKYVFLNDSKIVNSILVVSFAMFIVLAFFYPISQSWKKLELSMNTSMGVKKFSPAAPVNRYLTEDDLGLFSSISGKRFVAPAWKGLVIGVATGNYPLESKPSIITNNILSYSDFMRADCQAKISLAEKYKISYVYSTKFSCKNFDWLGASTEGLNLYGFKLKN